MPFTPDSGPFRVELWQDSEGDYRRVVVVIISDDFNHDAALTVSGDFCEIQDRLDYAKDLAHRMNQMPGVTRSQGDF